MLDTDVWDGIEVFGDNNLVKGNMITNSDESGVFVDGANNTIQDNTINESPIGLWVSAGNGGSGNRLFNTPVIHELLVAGAPAARSQNSLRRADIPHAALRKGLPR